LPTYEGDYNQALSDSLPPELKRALTKMVHEQESRAGRRLDDREEASARVRLFLQMMEGTLSVPITEDVTRSYRDPAQPDGIRQVSIPAGTLTGDRLYESDYINSSSVPIYRTRPEHHSDQRVMGRRPSDETTSSLILDKL
jgi:hypothetical protein